MQYWLVKSEPEAYAWTQFVSDKRTSWDGVRNFAARLHLRAMAVGDEVLFYESMTTKAVVGVAEVSKTAYPDPTAEEGEWVSVELKMLRPLARPVTLAEIKEEASLKDMWLIKQGRLSVTPLKKTEYDRILKLSGKKA